MTVHLEIKQFMFNLFIVYLRIKYTISWGFILHMYIGVSFICNFWCWNNKHNTKSVIKRTVYLQWRVIVHINHNSVYNSTCHEGTLSVRSHSVPSWQVVPRGRDSNFDTNIYGHTSSAHIVFTLLMHKQNRSGGYENREIPITWWSSCTLYGINRHNKLTTVCKCSDNLFQMCRPTLSAIWIEVARTRARTHTHV